ncbi:glycoside hydrolase family 130 protein [Halanaerobium saccharolyticum]|uniref:glycoside hydrolase family 130 protein n=1 Tax=Halanaerobium saccharolyticum TaxID=43595 RepID=UPI000DB9663B
MIKLKRLKDDPILKPIEENEWESKAVFNTAAVYKDDLYYLLYRSSDNDFELNSNKPEASEKFTSYIGYAVSKDGINFNRLINPVFEGETPQEDWGVEDPRITKLNDKYYMLYTAFGGRDWDDFRISMASSKNLIDWKRHGVVLDEPNKDAALFPKKINDKYFLLHRRVPDIWLGESADLDSWNNHQVIMKTRENSWEEKKIGIAGPPIETKKGWILIYHGVDNDHVYRLGIAVLDLNNPEKVIYRQQEPILEPEMEWETAGLVPNVVFSCGAVEKENEIIVYYGGADTVIGAASFNKQDLFNLLK